MAQTFVNPYNPTTPIGAGLQNIAAALFSGPGPNAIEAERQKAELNRQHGDLYRAQAAKARGETDQAAADAARIAEAPTNLTAMRLNVSPQRAREFTMPPQEGPSALLDVNPAAAASARDELAALYASMMIGGKNIANVGKYRTENTNERVRTGALDGTVPRGTVEDFGRATAAGDGKTLYSQNAEGSVLDRFGGYVNQDNPLAKAVITLRGSQAKERDAAAIMHGASGDASRAAARERDNRSGFKYGDSGGGTAPAAPGQPPVTQPGAATTWNGTPLRTEADARAAVGTIPQGPAVPPGADAAQVLFDQQFKSPISPRITATPSTFDANDLRMRASTGSGNGGGSGAAGGAVPMVPAAPQARSLQMPPEIAAQPREVQARWLLQQTRPGSDASHLAAMPDPANPGKYIYIPKVPGGEAPAPSGILSNENRREQQLNATLTRTIKPHLDVMDAYQRFNEIRKSGDSSQANQYLATQLMQMGKSGQRALSKGELERVLGTTFEGGDWADRAANYISQIASGVRTAETDARMNRLADAMANASADRIGQEVRNARASAPAGSNADNITGAQPRQYGRFVITPKGQKFVFSSADEAAQKLREAAALRTQ